jgi:hypothetical protein
MPGVDLRDGRDAVHARHRDVGHYDVRLQAVDQLDQFRAVAGFGDHVDTVDH